MTRPVLPAVLAEAFDAAAATAVVSGRRAPPRLIVKRLLLRRADDLFRVVHLGPGVGDVWLWRLADKGWPMLHLLETLREQLEAGTLTYEPEAATVVAERDTPKAAEHHARRMRVLEGLVDPEVYPRLMDGSLRGQLIQDAASRHEVSRAHVGNVLRLWWSGGMTSEALATRLDRCGAPGVQRDNRGSKVGRPRSLTQEVGVNADQDVRRHLQIAADLHLASKLTLQQALDEVCAKFYSVEVPGKDGRARRQVVPDRPTLNQLGYYVREKYPEHTRHRLRFGERVYVGSGRPLLGRADGDVVCAGDRFETGPTIADVYLVSEHDPLAIVGRPVVYAAIDAHSRLIVAVYVGFEGPSWVGAMMCLINMVTPKVRFCADRGIEINELDWPSHLAPAQIVADKGELMSVRLGKRIVSELGITMSQVTAFRGDLKGLIERRHRTLPTMWKPYAPGYVEADHGVRGSRDYRLDAALTLPEFEQMVLRSTIIHNTSPVRGVRIDAEMVRANLTSAPVDRWLWSLENHGHRLHALTPEKVALEVMPQETARVTAQGVVFKGGFYDCELARNEEWYDRARRKTWTEDVSFDPRDLGQVYLRNPRAKLGFERLTLLPPSEDRAGVSLFEVEKLDLERRRVQRAGDAERQNRRIEHAGVMNAVTAKAERRRDDALATSSLSKAARTKGIAANKALEKAARRAVEAVTLGDSEPVAISTRAEPAALPSPRAASRMERVNAMLRGGNP